MVAAPSGRRARILVVDDEPLIGAAVRRILCPFHEVVAVTSGQEALTQVRAGPQFDLILSDLMMPEMTGMDLYAELKRLAPALAEKIVFLTGGAFTSQAERFFAAVPNARVEKPFDVDQLLAVVNAGLYCASPSVQGVGNPLSVDEPTVDA